MLKLSFPQQFSVQLHLKKSALQVKLLKALLIVIFFTTSEISYSQCLAAPISPPCNPAGAVALIDNDIVAAGQIKTVNGTSVFAGLTVNGGTLIVCGSLTISSFAFSSGVIIVNPGGNMQVNISTAIVFGSNCSILNFGNFTITGSIVTGQNNLIYNVTTGSVFTVAFNQLIIQGPNTYLVNNGIVNSSYLIIQSTNSPGPVCSGTGSAIQTNIMINQYANAFTSPNGPSCINIVQWIINSQPMTASANVGICYMASAVSIIGSANFGSATVNNNCPNCGVALPLRIKDFAGTCENNLINLSWSAESPNNIKGFEIQESENLEDFETVGLISLNNEHNAGTFSYNFATDNSRTSLHYYRIKQIEYNNTYFYSTIVSASCDIENNVMISELINGMVAISSDKSIELIRIYDASGKIIKTEMPNNETTVQFNRELFSNGFYMIQLKTLEGEIINKKFILN